MTTHSPSDADALRAIAEGVVLDLSSEAAAEASARTLKARLLEMQGNASSANGGAKSDHSAMVKALERMANHDVAK